ncbi:MAG: hypothetical protein C0168_07315 [Candidatus Aminicenantes bacterium]|nr:MAG: hypothetical protein C0168_07315 [Candidatus Aminicenantes bacterium]
MWSKVNIVFRLKTPLHIGYLPFKGSVISPTRYYVPGRNLWGAVTKRITEWMYKIPNSGNYIEIGSQVIENFRFSYFYLYDGKTIYFPHFTEEGLKYGSTDRDKNKKTKSEFEYRFIRSRISTAIDPNSLTAKDESLHEIEFINNKFKDEEGEVRDLKIIGCVWFKDKGKIGDNEITKNKSGITIGNFNVFEELILGGESKYGFGHVVLDGVDEVEFPVELEEENENIKVHIKKDSPLLGHLKHDKNIKFRGDIELLSGRGYFDPYDKSKSADDKSIDKPGKVLSLAKYHFVPGTVMCESLSAFLRWDGTMELKTNETN